MRLYLLLALGLAGAGCGRVRFDEVLGGADAGNAVCNQVQSDTAFYGSGTAGDPFIVCTPQQFAHIGNDASLWASSFQLGRSIDLTGQALVPIGNMAQPFTGELDGQGLVINHGSISVDSIGGVFGATNGASLHDFDFMDIDVAAAAGSSNVGLLIGFATNTNLARIQARGAIHGPSATMNAFQSGGLVGDYEATSGASEISELGVELSFTDFRDAAGPLAGIMNVSRGTLSISDTRTRMTYVDASNAQNTFAGLAGKIAVVNGGVATIDGAVTVGEIESLQNGAFVGGIVGSASANGAGSRFVLRRASTAMTLLSSANFPGVPGAFGGVIGQLSSDDGADVVVERAASATTVTTFDSGSTYVGGLFGRVVIANGSTGRISDMIGSSDVHIAGATDGASMMLGGLVMVSSSMSFERVVSTSHIVADAPSMVARRGAVVGRGEGGGAPTTVSDIFWSSDVEPTAFGTMGYSFVGEEGKTDAQLRMPATYATWSPTVWNIVDGEYPSLIDIPVP